MPTIFVDLETRPAEWTLHRGLREAFAAVPGTHKKPDTINKWVEENASAAWLKTPLDPHHGFIACIGWAVDGGGLCVRAGMNERVLLEEFDAVVADVGPGALWCGHGVKGFDAPYLLRKAVQYGLWGLARSIPWPRHGDKFREDEKRIIDTKDLWRGSAFGAAPSLDEIATFLSLRTKAQSGMSGAEVWRAVGEGRWVEIGAYCMDDVERVRQIAVRLWRAGVIRADWRWVEAFEADAKADADDEDLNGLFDWPPGEGPRRGA